MSKYETEVYLAGYIAMSFDDAAELMRILGRATFVNKDYDSNAKMYKYSVAADKNVSVKLLSVAEQATLSMDLE
jgi:hypothetical protein